MSEGRDKQIWNHTASILSMLANANRDEKKRRQPYTAEDFNPYELRKREKEKVKLAMTDPKIGFAAMKAAFCPGEK